MFHLFGDLDSVDNNVTLASAPAMGTRIHFGRRLDKMCGPNVSCIHSPSGNSSNNVAGAKLRSGYPVFKQEDGECGFSGLTERSLLDTVTDMAESKADKEKETDDCERRWFAHLFSARKRSCCTALTAQKGEEAGMLITLERCDLSVDKMVHKKAYPYSQWMS